jgi:hypothetical protein
VTHPGAGAATRLLVEAALDTSGMTPAQVHARLPLWSIGTIRHALRELHQAGRIRVTGKVCRRKYMGLH